MSIRNVRNASVTIGSSDSGSTYYNFIDFIIITYIIYYNLDYHNLKRT